MNMILPSVLPLWGPNVAMAYKINTIHHLHEEAIFYLHFSKI